MKVWGNLLHLAPHFRFSKNLKVQILEICPSAQEFAIFTYIIDLKKSLLQAKDGLHKYLK
jgi:hypothetical protein